MDKFLKLGEVLLVLGGGYSQCKTFIVKNTEDGTSDGPGIWN
ncbi:rCG28210 [Rattus norvegicus]|uniref:RCG28210 n=1 Tax=Rattus norvegicus TaxID=10116 RepID=A6IEA0_RAT|nr:rCG28210 [Rattus norvegicus]